LISHRNSDYRISLIVALVVRKTGESKFRGLGMCNIRYLDCRALYEFGDFREELHRSLREHPKDMSQIRDAILQYNSRLVQMFEAMDTEVVELE
jgi:hypothetical protein